MKLVNVREMRQIEQAADAGGHSYAAMMELAGQAVADIATGLQLAEPGERVLVLVGPGNNGGDGLVAARFLRERDYNIALYLWKRDIKGDDNFRKLKQRRRGTVILWADNDPGYGKLREEIRRSELIIDALLGTGVTRPIDGQLAEILAVVKEEIIARRSAETVINPEAFGMPRFPLMEAYGLGAHVPPRPTLDGPDDDLFDPDFDSDGALARLDPAGTPGGAFEADEDEEDWEDEDIQRLPWPELPVLAVDCPSGLNCDTGALDPAALPAAVTVSFAYPKWGQLQFPGAGACGLLAVADIGVQEELVTEIVVELTVELVGPQDIQRWLPRRPPDAHKGTFGKALIAGGSLNYTGAAYLSGAAAAKAGAGLVTLAIPMPLHASLAGALPEATWLPLPGPEGVLTAAGVPQLLNAMEGYDALLVGPGLTSTADARGFIEALFSERLAKDKWRGRTVVDADALNLLAKLPDWPERLPPDSILTPHPGEMARLTETTVGDVNARRIENARRWAAQWGHIVLLKGPHTVIAAPDGRTAVLPFALPALATAGSGDVLAGAIVALLAQGLPAFEATFVGAYLHGQAGLLLSRTAPWGGVVARDILASFPEALQQLYTGS